MAVIMALVLSVSAVLAQQAQQQQQQPRAQPSGVFSGTAAPTSPAPQATQTQPPVPGAPPAPPGQQVTIYQYRGTGSQWGISDLPPDQLRQNLPQEWTTATTTGSFTVDRAVESQLYRYAKQFDAPPTAVYDGRIVWNEGPGGNIAIIQGTTTYTYYPGNRWTVTQIDSTGRATDTSINTINIAGTNYLSQSVTSRTVGTIEVRTNVETGATTYYTADGRQIAEKDLSPDTLAQVKEAQQLTQGAREAYNREQALARARPFWTELNTYVALYREYSGMAAWSALIFDEEFLQRWRDTVNKLMCDTLHLPTQECWTSKYCARHSEIKPTHDGVLFANPVRGGTPAAVAHIEGQRSLPMVTPNATAWGYTVTFTLTNPTEETMTYNVLFVGGNNPAWWSEPQLLGKGGTTSYVGASALYKISTQDYSSVCLTFDPEIIGFGGKRVRKLCNGIMQYGAGPTAPYPAPTNETATAPGAPPPAGPPPPGASV
jgi:hypothetical protein